MLRKPSTFRRRYRRTGQCATPHQCVRTPRGRILRRAPERRTPRLIGAGAFVRGLTVRRCLRASPAERRVARRWPVIHHSAGRRRTSRWPAGARPLRHRWRRPPLGELGVETCEPFVGLGVEALGEDVVALLVVAVGHAVLGRVELLGVVLVGLLQTQRDAATLQIDVDDLDHRVVTDGDPLIGHLDVALSQLGDVHQAFDALFDADERTERHQLGDLARHDLADGVGAGEVTPRVFLSRLERQRNPLAVHVDVEHLDGDLVDNLDNLGRVVDVLPRQLGDVHQTVHTAEVDERAEVDDRGHHTLADSALLQLVEELAAHLGLGLLEPGAPRQHHVVAVLVQLDDLGFDLLADVRLQIADPAHLDQRRGQEAAQADVEDQATLDDLDDGALDRLVLLLECLDGAPGALVLGALFGQNQTAFFVLFGEDQGFDFIAHGNDLIGVDVVLDGQFAGRDDAFGLVADVEQDFVPVNLDDGPFDDVAIVEVLDCFIDGGEKILARANVVDGYLRRGDGGTRHIVGLLRTGWGRRDSACCARERGAATCRGYSTAHTLAKLRPTASGVQSWWKSQWIFAMVHARG